ncbi:MAG: hypothetical protein ACFE7R_03890, partial [Candidatus Hodarchaeota archaeon]
MDPKTFGRRLAQFIVEYGLFIVILVLGLYIWSAVFSAAVTDYLGEELWRSRNVWLGPGVRPGEFTFEIFGVSYTVLYQFEGYTDYTFYYVHWGHNILNGVMPYSGEFGYILLDGVTNNNGAYIFPPLTAIFYGIGIMIPVDNWGIGFLLAAFGYLTVFPVYGLGRELSNNRQVGEVAALTYLITPNVLYHIGFLWTNPSPFIFFFFSGFYMLVKGKRHTGTLLIVVAALFKQTAWFLGIPLVVFLLMKPRPMPEDKDAHPNSEEQPESKETKNTEDESTSVVDVLNDNLKKLYGYLTTYFDFKGFLVSVIVVIIFIGAIMYPFIVAQPDFWNFMRLAMGGWRLDSYTEAPPYGMPIRLQVLPVVYGMPALAEILDVIVYSGGLLVMGVIVFWGLMVMEPKYEGKSKVYLRRLLFFAMLMMLWVNLTGPRGVFKYYFVLFAPFFSIFSSANMATSTEDRIPFSYSMFWMPLTFSLLILVPVREVYLMYVILIFVGYLLAKPIGEFW